MTSPYELLEQADQADLDMTIAQMGHDYRSAALEDPNHPFWNGFVDPDDMDRLLDELESLEYQYAQAEARLARLVQALWELVCQEQDA